MCAQRRLRSAWAVAQTDQSSLSAWWNLVSWTTHWAHSEDSDQTGRMPRLIWVRWPHRSFCWFCHVAAHFKWLCRRLWRITNHIRLRSIFSYDVSSLGHILVVSGSVVVLVVVVDWLGVVSGAATIIHIGFVKTKSSVCLSVCRLYVCLSVCLSVSLQKHLPLWLCILTGLANVRYLHSNSTNRNNYV